MPTRTPRDPKLSHYGKPGNRLGDDVKARVIEMAQQPGATRNGIARELGIGAASVSGIVKRAGLSFDRSRVKAATDARTTDIRSRRAEIMAALLEDAMKLRSQIWEPHEYIDHGGKDFDEARWTQTEPTAADKLKLMQAAASALGRHMDLDRHDADQAAEGAKSLLLDLGRALGVKPPDA